MTASSTAQEATTVRRTSFLRPRAILLLGVVIVPFAISAAFNSYGPLTEESAIRMAFATVAGQVLAILSAIVAVGVAAKRRYHPLRMVVVSVICVAVVIYALMACTSAGELLLTRLDLVAETDLLND